MPTEPTLAPDADDRWENVRLQQFPSARRNLNPGTLGTRAQAVHTAIQAFWRDDLHAWPLGQYQRGRACLGEIHAWATTLWGDPSVAITAGTSDTMTRLALTLATHLGPGPVRVLTSHHEHTGGLAGFLRHPGFVVEFLEDHALANPTHVARVMASTGSQVLFLSQITYTTGQRLPLAEIGAAVRATTPTAWLIYDAAQAVGLVAPIFADADAVVASGHKWLFGPPGTGFLWLSDRARQALAFGWSGEALAPEHPTCAFERCGGQDVASYAGLAAALALYAEIGPPAIAARSQALAGWFAETLHRQLLQHGIHHQFFDPDTGARVDAPPATERLHGVVHVDFPTQDPYPAYAVLDARGIHLKCIKRPGLATLRCGLPYYESQARLQPVITELVQALAE